MSLNVDPLFGLCRDLPFTTFGTATSPASMGIHSTYSISDLEVLSQVKRHTIRMWERRYGLLDPRRTATNIRTYSNDDLKRLLNVSLLNRHGLKISRIATMPAADIRRAVLDLSTAQENADGAMDILILAMLDLDEGRFN